MLDDSIILLRKHTTAGRDRRATSYRQDHAGYSRQAHLDGREDLRNGDAADDEEDDEADDADIPAERTLNKHARAQRPLLLRLLPVEHRAEVKQVPTGAYRGAFSKLITMSLTRNKIPKLHGKIFLTTKR